MEHSFDEVYEKYPEKMSYQNFILIKGYDVETIFKDVPLAVMEDKAEVILEEIKAEIEGNKTEDNKLGVQAIVSDSVGEEVHSNFIGDDTKERGVIRNMIHNIRILY